MICSSVNLARFICPSFVRPDSNSFWRIFSGAGHLRKTGIFVVLAGDFRRLVPEDRRVGRPETKPNTRKARISGPFSRLLGGLPKCGNGWLATQCDRACLRLNFLLAGNLTGKIPFLAPGKRVGKQEMAVLQGLLREFPTQTNRDFIWRNRDFSGSNREFEAGDQSRPETGRILRGPAIQIATMDTRQKPMMRRKASR
jgi:hypothetical protein